MIRAAGILIISKQGKALFLKRGPGSDMPGLWAFPGGRLEENEDSIDAAIRETQEEAGYSVKKSALVPWTRAVSPRETTGAPPTPAPTAPSPALPVAATPAGVEILDGDKVDFTTYLLKGVDEFQPELGPPGHPEHVAFAWAPIDQPPEPLHPGCLIALKKCSPTFTELDVANAIKDGVLTSPQKYENINLFAVRITGTGQAYRSGKKDDKGNVLYEAEHVWRDPSLYINPEFLARCNGLPVILEHPQATMLNGKEFSERVVGTIMLPYVAGEEVWGIAKIYDEAAAKMMTERQLSTSPAVVWGDPAANEAGKLENGERFLIEGKPSLLDHLAICWQGVWDKGGEPSGIITVRGDEDMTAEELAKLQKENADKFDKLMTSITGLTEGLKVVAGRQDSIESYFSSVRAREARARFDSFVFSKRKPGESMTDYSARHDAEEEELRKDAEEAGEKEPEKAAKDKRRDAEKEEEEGKDKKADAKRRADAFKFSSRKDGESDEDLKARRDAEEEELRKDMEEAGEEAAADKARKRRDAAEEEDKKADRKDSRADSVSRADFEALQKQFLELSKRDVNKPLTDDEINAFARAQGRADEIYSLLGARAPAPVPGQSLLSYRRQIAADLKQHSKTFKEAELTVAAADEKLFTPIEEVILKEALEAARSPATVKPGELRKHTIRLDSGHIVNEFYGTPDAWMGPMAGAVRQAATKFNLPKSE